MNIKLETEKDYILYKEEIIIAFRDFLLNKRVSNSIFFKSLQNSFQEITKYLDKRFVKMENDLCFDKKISACWFGLCSTPFKYMEAFDYDILYKDVINDMRLFYKNKYLDLPTKNELLTLTNLKQDEVIFPIMNARPAISPFLLFKYYNKIENAFFIRSFNMSRLPSRGDVKGLPLMLYRLYEEDTEELDNRQLFLLWIIHKLKPIDFENSFYNDLLKFDIKQDDLKTHKKIEFVENGIIGIDFGTTSTIIVEQDGDKLLPIHIGFNVDKGKDDVENPTLMEFIDFKTFLENYKKSKTDFMENVTISNIALNHLKDRSYMNIDSYFFGLKKWVEGKKRRLHIKDMKNSCFDIPPFLELKDGDIDLLEIFAYHLGLYINKNGIYLDYVLSLPIDSEKKLQMKIIDSFRKGITKSLPKKDTFNYLTITGRETTTAYLSMALERYKLIIENRVEYAVLDFGGGSMKFDFGVFRVADEHNDIENRYEYVIERLGLGSDKFLGGENLLELASCMLMEENRGLLDDLHITKYDIQKLNQQRLVRKLKLFVEGNFEIITDFEINFFNDNREEIKVKLVIDTTYLSMFLSDRISDGISLFMEKLNSFSFRNLNLFLAGNFANYNLIQKLLQKEIDKHHSDIKLFKPLDKEVTAIGLIKTRKGGRFLVKDLWGKKDQFHYILGLNRRGKFVKIINEHTEFKKWIKLVEANEDIFEIYYTDIPITNNQQKVSVKRKRLRIDKVDKNSYVYIRVVSSNQFEYVVSDEINIKNNRYLGKIYKIELKEI